MSCFGQGKMELKNTQLLEIPLYMAVNLNLEILKLMIMV